MAEQLVEVPTPFYIFEQNADIPVPRRRGARGGLQGFLPEQRSAASFPEQIVDIPVHGEAFAAFLSRQSSTAPSLETFDIPFSGGGLPGFHPRQSSTAPSQLIVDIPSSGGPHGLLRRQGSAASAAENVEFPAGGGLCGLRPGQGFPAFSGPEHSHDAPRGSRRGGGSVGGPQGSVPGQSSTARGRARHRRFAGRLFIPPCAEGCGFTDSNAVA